MAISLHDFSLTKEHTTYVFEPTNSMTNVMKYDERTDTCLEEQALATPTARKMYAALQRNGFTLLA